MITSVSLNPSIDRTIELDGLNIGALNRVAAQVDVAAGKGVNVALAVAALGGESTCIGFMYEGDREMFEERLKSQGVQSAFIDLPGRVRVNMKIFDSRSQVITELNAKGQPVPPNVVKILRAAVACSAMSSDFMILTGSLPPGCPAELYGNIIRDIASADSNCRVILDADGERLRAGIEARPYLIKPNLSELEGLCGRRLEGDREILRAANALVDAGCGIVAVSLGGDGALITDGREAWRAEGIQIAVRSTVAAGDSMVAALAVELDRGASLADAFRLGVAAATARCATDPALPLTDALCRDYADRVILRAL